MLIIACDLCKNSDLETLHSFMLHVQGLLDNTVAFLFDGLG
ncbi:MAG: hypothetical protein QM666_00565 [Acinetobacter sp.]